MEKSEMSSVKEMKMNEGSKAEKGGKPDAGRSKVRRGKKRKEEGSEAPIARKGIREDYMEVDEGGSEEQMKKKGGNTETTRDRDVTITKKTMMCGFLKRMVVEMRDVHQSQSENIQRMEIEVKAYGMERLELQRLVMKKLREDKIARIRRELLLMMFDEMKEHFQMRSKKIEELRNGIKEVKKMMKEMRQKAESLSELKCFEDRLKSIRANMETLSDIVLRTQETVPKCIEKVENVTNARAP